MSTPTLLFVPAWSLPKPVSERLPDPKVCSVPPSTLIPLKLPVAVPVGLAVSVIPPLTVVTLDPATSKIFLAEDSETAPVPDVTMSALVLARVIAVVALVFVAVALYWITRWYDAQRTVAASATGA